MAFDINSPNQGLPNRIEWPNTKNRTLVEIVQCMVLTNNSLKFPWETTFNTITYLVNQSPTKANSRLILKEKFTCIQPNLSNLKIRLRTGLQLIMRRHLLEW